MQSQRWRRRWWRLWRQTYAKKRTFLFCPRSIYFLFLFLHLCVHRSSDQLTGFHVCFGLPVKRIICASSKLHGISEKLSDDQQNTTPTAYAQKNAHVYYSTLNEIHRKQDHLLAPTVFFLLLSLCRLFTHLFAFSRFAKYECRVFFWRLQLRHRCLDDEHIQIFRKRKFENRK